MDGRRRVRAKDLLQIAMLRWGSLAFPSSPRERQHRSDRDTILTLLNAEGEELRDTPEDGWTAMQPNSTSS